MLQQPTAATPAEPLESLSFPDMHEVEAVLSPQDVNKGLAQADPLTHLSTRCLCFLVFLGARCEVCFGPWGGLLSTSPWTP